MTEDQGADEDQGGADSGVDPAQEADQSDETEENQGASLASVRAQAQDLRDRLAGEMDAPAQQDEQAARRRATAEDGGEGNAGDLEEQAVRSGATGDDTEETDGNSTTDDPEE